MSIHEDYSIWNIIAYFTTMYFREKKHCTLILFPLVWLWNTRICQTFLAIRACAKVWWCDTVIRQVRWCNIHTPLNTIYVLKCSDLHSLHYQMMFLLTLKKRKIIFFFQIHRWYLESVEAYDVKITNSYIIVVNNYD